MNQSNVQTNLDQIEQLPGAERQLLHQCLAERAQAEWRREAEAARRLARERGVDQTAMDQAIHNLRHSKW